MIRAGQPALLLAPMEGITDAPMRAFLTELGGFDLCVSEFLRISQGALPPKVIRRHMPEILNGCKTSAGVPVQLQLLGGSPEYLAMTARNAVQAGATSIDLNFGCPAPLVNRHDGGASLLKDPPRLRAIVQAVRSAVPLEIPVSAKLRLGWESIDEIDHNAEMAAQGGASWLTLHARTRMQGYRPPAWWKKIAEVRRRLSPLPIIANGEIWSREDFLRCQQETGCEHFMIGRGALADPTLPAWIHSQLHGKNEGQTMITTFDTWQRWISRFAEISQPHLSTSRAIGSRIKQWLKFTQMKVELPWFETIKRMETSVEILGWMAKQV